MPIDRLILPERVARSLWEHASECSPAEACGFLAGRDGQVEQAIRILNQAAESGRFSMDPADQVRAHYRILDEGLDLMAVYHSHPAGPVRPSATDERELGGMGLVQVIVHGTQGGWELRAFCWSRGSFQSLPVGIDGDGGLISIADHPGEEER
ncbi:MAG: M67 family metallopeptidase [Anaerolineales bacterium]